MRNSSFIPLLPVFQIVSCAAKMNQIYEQLKGTETMDYRVLGTTGMKVSELCLGVMPFGGDVDKAAATKIFSRSRDAGINFFDCANVYGHGRAEELLGELIQECRNEVVITSKAYFPMGADPNAQGSSRFHLRTAVHESLRRLKTDRIDIYFLHRFDDATDLTDTLRTLEQLVQQGKILYTAASNFAAWQITKALGISALKNWSQFACIQPMYNLAKRQAEVEILPMASAEKLGVITYSPLGGGLFSGKYGVGKKPGKGRLVDNKMYQTRYADIQNYQIADNFARFAAENGHEPSTLAIAWVGSHHAVTAPIIGVKNLNQLEAALAATEIDMTPEFRNEINSLSPAPAPATDRNEEGSKYTYGGALGTQPSGSKK